jgi:hypothetical protein
VRESILYKSSPVNLQEANLPAVFEEETISKPHRIFTNTVLKGTVRRDVTRVNNRLKQLVLTNYVTASLYFLILKRHLRERSKNSLSV